MSIASTARGLLGGLAMGALGVALVVASTAAQEKGAGISIACESGILDSGEAGMNVLVYELCADRLTIGFKSSDVIEEVFCRPDGEVRLWQLTGDPRCDALPEPAHDRTIELEEPLRGVGRTTTAPVRKLLTCRIGGMNRATLVVPEARQALLETRKGNTLYEKVTRLLIARCVGPTA